ncbi:hypothetical protein FACS1894170_11890 [Planctomycetales bacterium]|nr:hypothetical protein FACS1894170_11890 [Planctomycetales bacterium]
MIDSSIPTLPPINNGDIYILNPYFRLRSENNFTLVYGDQGGGTFHIHKSYGIVLSLCDGKRTVEEIAKITVPFTEDGNILSSLSHCKRIMSWMSLSKAEQMSRQAVPNSHPSDAPLILKKDYDLIFREPFEHPTNYNVTDLISNNNNMGQLLVSTLPYRESIPLSIQWHLTSDCSTDCRYCYLGRRGVKPLPKSRALEIVEEAAALIIPSLNLAGGDILLYPHLYDLLSVMMKYNFLPIALSTKSLLSKEKAQEISLFRSLISELQFSIDTDDDQIANFLLGVNDYPARIFSSIDNAIDAGIRVNTKAVLTPYNILTVPRLYRKLKKHGVSEIRMASYGRSGFHHTNDMFLNDQCYSWLESEIEKLRSEFPHDNIMIQNGGPLLEPQSRLRREKVWKTRSTCTAGRSAMMICTDGKVIPCEQMPETEEYFCGDLTKQSIMEVWNGNKLKEMTYGMPREKFKGQPCYDCEEREECHNVMGYCIRDLAAHYGNIYQPPPNCYRHDLPFVRQT